MRRSVVPIVACMAVWAVTPVFALPSDVTRLPFAPDVRGAASALVVQPDGKMLVGVNGAGIWRLDAAGRPDPTFGKGGIVDEATLCDSPSVGASPCSVRAVARAPNGRVYVLLYSQTLVALEAGGTVDATFGNGGRVRVNTFADATGMALAVAADGTLVVGVDESIALDAYSSVEKSIVYRFDGNGRRLATTAPATPGGGAIVHDGYLNDLAVQADGKLAAAGVGFAPQRGWVARTLADGAPDSTFVGAGLPADFVPFGLTPLADGSLLLAGPLYGVNGAKLAIARVLPSGAADPGFGTAGLIVVSPPGTSSGVALDVAADARGRILVAGFTWDPGGEDGLRRAIVVRVLGDGTLDDTFAAHGYTLFFAGYSSRAIAIASGPNDSILVAGTAEAAPVFVGVGGHWFRDDRPALFGLTGGDGAERLLYAEANAVEYFSASLGHYFVTATSGEIARLDTYGGPNGGDWQRTGRSFRVWTEPALGTKAVCRYFSGSQFAPRSSHFYTPYEGECALLRSGSAWTFEGDVFWLRMPEGVAGARDCPPPLRRVHRAYNNGMTGAPNHRYTDDSRLLDRMLALGWIMEGEAQTRVFACAPR